MNITCILLRHRPYMVRLFSTRRPYSDYSGVCMRNLRFINVFAISFFVGMGTKMYQETGYSGVRRGADIVPGSIKRRARYRFEHSHPFIQQWGDHLILPGQAGH